MVDIPSITKEKRIYSPNGDVVHFLKKTSDGFSGFGEAYFSIIKPSQIKAWKLHRTATCNLTTIQGQVRFVIQDKKETSFLSFLLSDEDQNRLTIPPGFWFGFQNLGTTEAIVLNIIDIVHNSEEQVSVERKNIEFNWENKK